jgi:hypothetical protein
MVTMYFQRDRNKLFKNDYIYDVVQQKPRNPFAECDRPLFVLQPIYPVSSLSLHRPPFSLSLSLSLSFHIPMMLSSSSIYGSDFGGKEKKKQRLSE